MSDLYKLHGLNNSQVGRYGRQLITPGVGVAGQEALLAAKVLVVGAGGLGCPIAMYLAGAGVGTIGIVDYDTVEVGNLHRQIGHNELKEGHAKAVSLATACQQLNSSISVIPHTVTFTSDTALDLIARYDIVVDASDNVATRYLINDASVLANKILVSGSALKWDGQVTVYHYNNGPCYRCLFPVPPPAETVTRCSDGGVLGPIVGVIGSLQALEVIKIITNNSDGVLSGRLMLYDGLAGTFKTVKIRSRQPGCVVCGDNPTLTELIDYPQFCSSPYSDKSSKVDDRIEDELIMTCKQYKSILDTNKKHILLDVRPKNQFEICSLPNSTNIPIDELSRESSIKTIEELAINENEILPIYIVCRRGNKSQDAATILGNKLNSTEKSTNSFIIKHIRDGLTGWNEEIDPTFPLY
ncbi:molybdenum cofactor synthesis 3 [Heterostelium album PN500]|uniref:Adenylyltransferase and sulfurtransferase MOCS3 homolog n=1 Tax=Heterostelium pallidum (strain ATCC 26659 / Pp 5 / PN500) TaxID=670386 RepID=D3BLV1_HETP5|nr:molybdenum cofactor synthesis 3 [Heterostelium album PN500]EFA77552.1 molybdenum cofactor synthesis 3 [Heterostelium album PN500]|eukprot:XP_020429680.1 molybdenum cofactor synthesis 3 [Heterostelium album PN500]